MEADMKKPGFFLLILILLAVFFNAACSPGGSASRKTNCSTEGDVCIVTSVDEPIRASEPINLSIQVTSSKDISNLNVTLHTSTDVTTDGPNGWEKYLSNTLIQPGYAIWNFDIKAGQTLTFKRVLHFPPNEGYFTVSAEVLNTGGTLVGTDTFIVHMTKGGGTIYREGTSLPPYTPNITSPAYGPGTPVPTFLYPSNTPTTLVTSPAPTQFVPLVGTSYPSPSPLPSPTPNLTPYP
jgi:hypothetical protein